MYRFPFETAQNLPQILYRTQSGLPVAPHKSSALLLSTKHTVETVLSSKGLQLRRRSAALSEGASTVMLDLGFAKCASVYITYKLWSAPQGKCQRRGRRGGY